MTGEPSKLGPYELIAKIGEGGMGEVYRARDERLNRTVAIKFIRGTARADSQSRQRFLEEARAAAALDHPNIGSVFDIGEDPDRGVYLVMAYYSGRLLRDIIRDGLTVEQAVAFAAQVSRGLAAAHAAGIIHRDIKPSNVIVTSDGTAKIIDFGLARIEDATMTLTGTTRGTPVYMSPEQIRAQTIDTRSDLWSLGVMLYEMLTGQTPFRGDQQAVLMHAILETEPAPASSLRPGIPPALDRIMGRLLEKEKESRLASAAELESQLAACLAAPSPVRSPGPRGLRAAAAAAIALAAFLGYREYRERRSTDVRASVERAILEGRFTDAFLAASEDPAAISTTQWDRMSVSFALDIQPDSRGAEVEWKPYATPSSPWRKIAVDGERRWPFEPIRLRVRKPGYQEHEVMVATYPRLPTGKRTVELFSEASRVEGMVEVGSPRFSTGSPGTVDFRMTGLQSRFAKVPRFWIDRYEVTNRQFKAFVDAGGYAKREYWTERFMQDGKEIPWERAMDLLRDRTGRAGPAVWEAGTYRSGLEDHPVEGVSWYEAMAYAKFVGKSLPTYPVWYLVASPFYSYAIGSLANFASTGTTATGSRNALGLQGTHDHAGNVREWLWNDNGEGKKYIPGGAWNTDAYSFVETFLLDPLDRSPGNGFRCIKYSEPPAADLTDPIRRAIPRDYSKIKPLPPETLAAYMALYRGTPAALEARVETTDDSSEYWTKDRVSFASGYSSERVPAYLFRPKNAKSPYQSVIWYPWATGLNAPSSQYLLNMEFLDFVIKSGRAVLYPIYAGHYERKMPNVSGRDIEILRVKEISRAIDYLESREDIAKGKYAYYGASAGGSPAPYLGGETRLKAVIVSDWGFPWTEPKLPERDPVNFAPLMKAPFLLINGRYDHWNPPAVRDPVIGFFGAPAEHKRHALLDTSHFAIAKKDELMREVLGWLDRYLGPVR